MNFELGLFMEQAFLDPLWFFSDAGAVPPDFLYAAYRLPAAVGSAQLRHWQRAGEQNTVPDMPGAGRLLKGEIA